MNDRYDLEPYTAQILLLLPKSMKEDIKILAKFKGDSVNGWIRTALKKELNKMKNRLEAFDDYLETKE